VIKTGVAARVEIDKTGTISIITNDHTPIEPVAEKVDDDPVSDWDIAINGKRS
jgi:hypothetical protein